MVRIKIEVNFVIFSRHLKGDAARSVSKIVNQEIREKLSQTLLEFPIIPQKGHLINLLDFVDDIGLSADARNYILDIARTQAEDNLFQREITAIVIGKGYLLVRC